MGVPGFFSWLIRNYKKKEFILNKIDEDVNIFYIDANCLFHPQCFKILDNMVGENDINKLESNMFKRIINYLDYLIDLVDPKVLTYIAVDGVAPLAKINQQRKRRFRSIDDNKLKNSIKKKYDIKYNDIWNNTVITPGTKFMERLHKQILKHFRKNKKRKIIYSSYHTPGEGEHKILQHIKHESRKIDGPYVIYGLDADLFFLSMSSQVNNIYLLREESHIIGGKEAELYDIVEDVAEELKFISVEQTKDCLNKQINKMINDKNIINIKEKDFINDFIFLCFLLGNDFIPNIPSLDIKKHGLNIILDSYCDMYINCGKHIIKNDYEIDEDILMELFKRLSYVENTYFRKTLPYFNYRKENKRCFSNDPYSIEVWNMDNLKNIDIEDPIKLGHGNSDEWKFRYYEHYFHTTIYQSQVIDEICYDYLKSLKWIIDYYFKKCQDWKWQYKYNYAPFISDLYNYLKHDQKFKFSNIKFKNNKALKPYVQLLCVLPPKCSHLLPKSYQKLVNNSDSNIIDMFPSKITLDMINKDMYWQCIPNIPILDIERILEETSKIKLKDSENKMNKIIKDINI